MKIGARIAHLAILAGMMMSTTIVTTMIPSNRKMLATLRSSRMSPSVIATTWAMLLKSK